MIFITVGTHEQPFNRLLKSIDRLVENKVITEKIVAQIGFSTYEPQHYEWEKLYSFEKMNEFVRTARIVITHGGPSSFIMPLQIGKIPIVVPRQKKYGEHINDHQLIFCREVSKRQGNIIEVEDMERLTYVITNYDSLIASMDSSQNSNNLNFCKELEHIVAKLF